MARTYHHDDFRFDTDDEPRRDFRPYEADDERPWMNDDDLEWNDEDWFDDDWKTDSVDDWAGPRAE